MTLVASLTQPMEAAQVGSVLTCGEFGRGREVGAAVALLHNQHLAKLAHRGLVSEDEWVTGLGTADGPAISDDQAPMVLALDGDRPAGTIAYDQGTLRNGFVVARIG